MFSTRMQNTHYSVRISVLILLVLVAESAALSQSNTTMNWWGLSGGFGVSSVTNTKLTLDIGQPFVGRSVVANTVVESGFLTHPFLGGPPVSVSEPQVLPMTFELFQNYPNPFNPTTTIRYSLPKQSRVVLTIYNIIGQEVTRLVDEMQDAGTKSVVWSARNTAGMSVASGVYLYRFEAVSGESTERFTQIRRLLVLK